MIQAAPPSGPEPSDEPPKAPGDERADEPLKGQIKWARTRLPFETAESPFKAAARKGGMLFYAILTLGFAGLALYMAFVERHPMTGPYVMAPAVGAAWFAVRFVVQLRPRM